MFPCGVWGEATTSPVNFHFRFSVVLTYFGMGIVKHYGVTRLRCRRRNVLRRQGEIGGFRFPPLFPLTPSPLETSRDTLHPGTRGYVRTNRPAGRVRRLGLRGCDGVATPNPAWGFHPQTPSPLRVGLNRVWRQLSRSDSVVRVKGTMFPCGVWGKAPTCPNVPLDEQV